MKKIFLELNFSSTGEEFIVGVDDISVVEQDNGDCLLTIKSGRCIEVSQSYDHVLELLGVELEQ